jgi:hypothetical protein
MTRILEGSISGSPTFITAIVSSPLDDVTALTGGQAKVISLSYREFVSLQRKNAGLYMIVLLKYLNAQHSLLGEL